MLSALGGLLACEVALRVYLFRFADAERLTKYARFDDLPPEAQKDNDVQAARAAIELAEQAEQAGDLAEHEAKLRANPADHQARFDLAVAQFGPLPTLYGAERPGIVHRLDRDTSGLLLLGRTPEALAALKAAFQAREVAKTYLAIVRGEPRFDTEWIVARLGRTSSRRDRISVVGEGEGREASTYYEVRERFDGFALLAVFPKTGRTHQVRVHLGSVGLPLLGEELYLPKRTRSPAPKPGDPVIARQALHAHALELAHPASGEALRFEAPLPADMAGALATLRLNRRGA